ncbi:MAG TPA: radical SAM protein [Prolixibacteraceae bacterium]|nr:radical SAM protein [Prolixibacteraceae bacterium]
MSAYLNYLNSLLNNTRRQFPEYAADLKPLNYARALALESQRDQLLDSMGSRLNWSFKQTKPWINRLSEGCRLCGKGEWSCLFITGKCNAGCFYCPAPQLTDGLPETQQLTFGNPEVYIAYLNHFGFGGVSLSGGEPLLVFDRTLRFIREVRKKTAPSVYLWMYTNGILADEEKFRQLADAGLDEIRFDIGATRYHLDAVKKAKGIIPHVTIEIPAVPEEKELIKKLLPEMVEAGVTNLHLHQLRLTTHNIPKLLPRNYSYLQAEQPAVAESELAALEIMHAALEQGFDIGINYCCFQYKNRFQKAGYRRKIAARFAEPGEELTENGYLRKIFVLPAQDAPAKATPVNPLLTATELPDLPNDEKKLSVFYRTVKLRDSENGSAAGQTFRLGEKDYRVESGFAVQALEIEPEEQAGFMELIHEEVPQIPDSPALFKAWKHERIEEGWRNYF